MTIFNAGGSAKKYIEEKTLWENASITSNFAAQTISVDTTPYDYIIIDFLGRDRRVFKRNEQRQCLDSTLITSLGIVSMSRYVTKADNGISFTAGTYMNGAWKTDNSLFKPERIIGVKGVQ